MNKSRWSYLLSCLVIVGVFGVILLFAGYVYMTVSAAPQAVVFIRAPQDGAQLEAGQPVQVRALARDERKITRIELWVDGQLIDAQTSNTQSGINPFPLLTTWYPQVGAHTLIVRAFSSRGETSQASITVNAVTFPDRDADGVSDSDDTCPDQPGNPIADGCPDRDFDGIADSLDACPDQAGMPPDGCPAPGADDRDGDGVIDVADACPDVAGSPLADGCLDMDGDGIGDAFDACPAEPGSGADGCPDAGSVPESAPGGELPEPLPGSEPPTPEDESVVPGLAFPFFFQAFPISINLEVEAYSMYVREYYETVWCYVRLGDEDPRRYEFNTLGEQQWDIAAELAGANSVRLLHPGTEPLTLWANCFGAYADGEPEDMGVITATHPREEWDGREFMGRPEGENLFSVTYHICTPSCDEAALQAPQLAPITTGPTGNGPYTMRWRWDGDETAIDGYFITINTISSSGTVSSQYLFVDNPSFRSMDVADYMPACGETNTFSMSVYKQTDAGRIHSPESNTVPWPGEPCDYTASVTFMTIDVHNPPVDEDNLHRPGPIYGEFWISDGTTIESLDFNACWCYHGPFASIFGRCEGLKLEHGVYSINRGIFDWIERAQASCLGNGCRSNYYYAPSSSSVSLPLQDGDDITIGGRIMDCDERLNPSDTLYQEQETLTINISDLEYLTVPIQRTLNGDYVNLEYYVRMGH